MNKLIKLSFFFVSLALAGCTPEMNRLGSSILSQTGFVNSGQADALFAVGGKLSKATQSVTDEQEYYLGRAVAATVFSRYKPYVNRPFTLYANKIALVLASNSTRPATFGGYKVAVLDTAEVNAVSAPGGFILISRGFIDILDSEDELAAIIAHEIGHVALKHGMSAISDSNLTDALQIVGKEAASMSGNVAVNELNSLFGDSVNEVVGALLDEGYSRSAEYDADTYAATLLKQSGYNPKALGQALQKLKGVSNSKGGWFDTHPSPGDREDEIASLLNGVPASPGESKRTARFVKSTIKSKG